MASVLPGFVPEECAKAASKNRVDVFELNYLGAYLSKKSK